MRTARLGKMKSRVLAAPWREIGRRARMEVSWLLVQQIASMVLMGLAGYGVGKLKLITGEQSRVLSCMCIYLAVPCSLMTSFNTAMEADKLTGLLLALGAAVLLHLLYLALNGLMNRSGHGLAPEEQASVIYNNAGNLILPMVMAILGQEYVIYTSVYILVQNILMWTHGQKLMGGAQQFDWKKIVTTPAIAAILAGFFLVALIRVFSSPFRLALKLLLNTLLRKAIEPSKVHPYYIDAISSKYSRIIEEANEVPNEMMWQMTRDYCAYVRRYSLKEYSPAVQKVMNYVNLNVAEPLTLKSLAAMCFISPSYLSALFKQETGSTLIDYINTQRVNRAAQLLVQNNHTIAAVAEEVGILDVNYFTKIFKKTLGVTPTRYRREHKEK